MTITTIDRLLTPNQVCQQLAISRMTLWRYVQQGRIPEIRLGARSVRYRASDIETLINRHLHDDRHIQRLAIQRMAETQAEETRPLCPDCGKRRVNRNASICTYCIQRRDLQLMHKRNYWTKKGSADRKAQKQKARETEDD